MNRPTHYLSPKLHGLNSPDGDIAGVFATDKIQPNELLCVWGGRIAKKRGQDIQTANPLHLPLQVADHLFLVPFNTAEPADFFNHSCEPNAGLRGQIALVALREIDPGEQICFDYAMFFASDDDPFVCHCESPNCRRQVTGQDWRRTELWTKYSGHFSPYIQHKIELLQAGIEPGRDSFEIPERDPQELSRATHFLSPKLAAGKTPQKGHNGVFAIAPINKGELLTAWGGIIVQFVDLSSLEVYQQRQAIQVEEGLHLAPYGPSEPADYFNHSCSPNAGLDGQNMLVALRQISTGEEVCFDYATSDSTPYDEFQCGCGEALCRKFISADDWRLPELWERYANHFSPYLQIRIDSLKGNW